MEKQEQMKGRRTSQVLEWDVEQLYSGSAAVTEEVHLPYWPGEGMGKNRKGANRVGKGNNSFGEINKVGNGTFLRSLEQKGLDIDRKGELINNLNGMPKWK